MIKILMDINTSILLLLYAIILHSTVKGFSVCHSGLCKNGGTCKTTSPGYAHCECLAGYVGEYCEVVSSCGRTGQCLHGECRVGAGGNYCLCHIGYEGLRCERLSRDSACFNNPCRQGATCQLRGSLTDFTCLCPSHLSGKLCEYDNACMNEPCRYGGTCLPEGPSFTCHCPPGLTGSTCSLDIDECLDSPSVCRNEGKCENTFGSYRCRCAAEFTGRNCERAVMVCSPNPCMYGGTCVITGRSTYQCTCPKGQTGRRCEISEDSCRTRRCENAGQCQVLRGEHVCKCAPGWSGRFCTEDVNECLMGGEGLCKNGGSCLNMPGGYSCICVNGWTGEDCGINIDDCVDRPCFNSGTCHDLVGSYYCECPKGKTGLRCHIDDACVSSPCKAGSVCESSPINGEYVCTCARGWSGENCDRDVNECMESWTSLCEHGGVCVNLPGSFRCACTEGFTGERCEVNENECASSPCQHHGTCLDQRGKFSCLCVNGYEGVFCEREINECLSNPCQHGGTCVDMINSFKCVCPQGYHDHLCASKINECSSNPCMNSGTCVDGISSCLCSDGYGGLRCNERVDPCSSNPCNHGSCRVSDGKAMCTCEPGYTGLYCDAVVNLCSGNPCQHGVCIEDTSGYKCVCDQWYTGRNCSVKVGDPCTGQNCKNGAKCVAQDNARGFTCQCSQGFTGAHCEMDINECSMYNGICKNGGTCSNTNGSYVCQCVQGFQGNNCELNINDCAKNACINGGECIDGVNGFTCRCKAGFEGQRCEIDINECTSHPCHNNATCKDFVASFVCECAPGFDGLLCENNVNDCSESACLHGVCVDGLNSYQCVCESGFTGQNCERGVDPCESHPCLNEGRCDKNLDQGGFQCRCQKGFEGVNCEKVVEWCRGEPCFNGGTCSQQGHEFTCHCPPTFTGQTCDLILATCEETAASFSLPVSELCRNGGQCLDQGEGGHICVCVGGFEGGYCEKEKDECAGNPCRNGGVCSDARGDYVCECVAGFEGKNCEIDVDECAIANLCRNGGTCLNLLNKFHCSCPPGTEGLLCEIDVEGCGNESCQGGATCVDTLNGFSCVCPPGLTGQYCQADINECASEPCHTEGAIECVQMTGGDYRCLCKEGWAGVHCQQRLTPCDVTPCMNGATCRNNDNTSFHCDCAKGYSGLRCEYSHTLCSSNPCNSGTCVPIESGFKCTCTHGVTGTYCDLDELNECLTKPCQHGGRCFDKLGTYECECPKFWNGQNCDTFDHNFEGGIGVVTTTQSTTTQSMCQVNQCHLKANNGICDEDCNTHECQYDGNECSYRLKLYSNCSAVRQGVRCYDLFNNGQCDSVCNSEFCLYDGFDCQSPVAQCNPVFDSYCLHHYGDGSCDNGCNTEECGWDGMDCERGAREQMLEGSLVFIILLKPDEFRKVEVQFLRQLGLLIHSHAVVQVDEGGEEMIREWKGELNATRGLVGVFGADGKKIGKRKRASDTIQGSMVNIQLDNSKCVSQCFHSTDSAAEFIAQSMRQGWEPSAPVYSVKSESSRRTPAGPPYLLILVSISAVLIISFLVAVLYAVAAKKVSIPGSTWFPEGFRFASTGLPPNSAKRKKSKSIFNQLSCNGLTGEELGAMGGCKASSISKINYNDDDDDDFESDAETCKRFKYDESEDKKSSLSEEKHLMAASLLTPPHHSYDPHEPLSCDVNFRGPGGYTPLMLASLYGARKRRSVPDSDSTGSTEVEDPTSGTIVSDLISHGAAINCATDVTGETALHLAARHCQSEVVKKLLESGQCDPNAKDNTGRTSLHSAIAADAHQVLMILLRHRATKVNAQMNDGTTPLILASRLSLDGAVDELLNVDADIAITDETGKTALHWAAAVNNVDTVVTLLRHNANKDSQDSYDQTPLFLAAKEGSYEAVKVLLNFDANRDIADNMERLPRDVAHESMHYDIVRLLDEYRVPTVSHSISVSNSPPDVKPKIKKRQAVEEQFHKGGGDEGQKIWTISNLAIKQAENDGFSFGPSCRFMESKHQYMDDTASVTGVFEYPPSYETACSLEDLRYLEQLHQQHIPEQCARNVVTRNSFLSQNTPGNTTQSCQAFRDQGVNSNQQIYDVPYSARFHQMAPQNNGRGLNYANMYQNAEDGIGNGRGILSLMDNEYMQGDSGRQAVHCTVNSIRKRALPLSPTHLQALQQNAVIQGGLHPSYHSMQRCSASNIQKNMSITEPCNYNDLSGNGNTNLNRNGTNINRNTNTGNLNRNGNISKRDFRSNGKQSEDDNLLQCNTQDSYSLHHYLTPPSQHSQSSEAPPHVPASRFPLEQYATPSPDSPGHWSSGSSPFSAQSDWSRGISSPPQILHKHLPTKGNV